jgi:hypothetical protein
MTDDDLLLETVRAEFAHVRLDAPVEDVLARGARLRRRRAVPALGTGTLAAVAALTFGLGATTPGGATPATLTAWSVTTGPGHTVNLTIRDQRLSGPERAKLRKALQAAGVPAVVETRPPRICRLALSPVPRLFTFSRHHGRLTFNIKLGQLPKRAQIAVVLPHRGHQVPVGARFLKLPQVAVLPSGLRCGITVPWPTKYQVSRAIRVRYTR